jgi:hypothetical protein
MTELTAETTFNIIAAPEVFMEFEDLYLHPENAGSGALRELRYPGDVLPPFIYETNPDRWDNFDSVPWTPRPMVERAEDPGVRPGGAVAGLPAGQPGAGDLAGTGYRSRMTAYMLRRCTNIT